MRTPLWPLVAASTLAAFGCAGGGQHPAAPAGTGDPAAPALGAAVVRDDLAASALGIYTVEVDPATLSATSHLKATRTGQATDDLYLLPIDGFLKPNSFEVETIAVGADTVDLTYVVRHPFPAPADLDAPPNGSTNRADLGIAAIALFLADVPSATGNTFFGTVVANTDLVANADAYYNPTGLLNLATTANTFPYKLVVDEAIGTDGNRLQISNGGDPTGDYGADGWTRAEMGQYNDDWAGYGVLHQGQAARNTVSLDRDTLSAAAFSFDVALIAKYNDPRGGTTGAEKKANRLPPAVPDHTRFAYRMPHGAWDVQKVTFAGESGGFVKDSLSASTLYFHVEDWDARSAETTLPDLSQDPVLTNVAVGESGTPTVAVSIPGVIGDATASYAFTLPVQDDDSGFGGDVSGDSGMPQDPLFYCEPVNSQASGPAEGGDYTGLVRVTDPEVLNISDPAFILELDGSLTPLSSNIPEPVAYQAFTVNVEVPILNTGWGIGFGSSSGSEDADDIIVDANGNVIVTGAVRGPVNFGTGPTPYFGGWDPFVAKFDPNGTFLWARVFGGTDCCYDERVESVALDSTGNVYAAGWWKGTADFGGGPRTGSTGGYSNIFIVKYDPSGAWVWDKTFGMATASSEVNGIDVDPAGNIHIAGFFYNTLNLGGSNLVNSGTSNDIFVAKLNNTGGHIWSRSFGGSLSSSIDQAYAVAADSAGNTYATGFYSNTIDWGVGPVSNFGSFDGFLLKLDGGNGSYVWDKVYRGTAADSGWAVEVEGNEVVVGGYFRTSVSFGGPVRTATDAGSWVAKYTTTGTYMWDRTFDGTLGDFTRDVALDPATGDVYVSGEYRNTVDFGGGPRTSTSGADAFVVKLNTDGTYEWDAIWNPGPIDVAHAIAVGPSGDAYVTGEFSGTRDLDPHPVNIFNVTSVGFEDVYVAKLLKATGTF